MNQMLVQRILIESLGLYLYLVMIKFTLLQPFLLIMFIYKMRARERKYRI